MEINSSSKSLKYRGKLPMLHDSPRHATRNPARNAPASRDTTTVGIRRFEWFTAADERKFLRTLKKA
ncbi:MAG: hypothetical protein ACTHJP_10040 [Rhodanobacteraceae bacterium]